MIAAFLVLAQASNYGKGVAYFPLIPKSVWSYSISNQPGTTFEVKCLDPIDDVSAADGSFQVPCVLSTNGHVTGKLAYKMKGVSLFIVAGADGLPIPPRKVMVFSPDQTWDYITDTNSIIYTAPIITTCTTTAGKPEKWFGQMKNTLVCKSVMKIEKGKDFNVTQVSTYAEGIGLVKLVQTGHEGKNKIDSTQTLVSYKPGPDQKASDS